MRNKALKEIENQINLFKRLIARTSNDLEKHADSDKLVDKSSKWFDDLEMWLYIKSCVVGE